jgi:hypothetical protein
VGFYHKAEWKAFRARRIELDGFKCVDCERYEFDGAVLQVHHKRYIKGNKPWDYAPDDCETLCKGCHAEKHGRIVPKSGWTYVCDDDLGDLSGTCEVCGTGLRYVFTISHDNWFDLEVGTICCDNLTGTKIASDKRKDVERKNRFVNSPRWKSGALGSAIIENKTEIIIRKGKDNFFSQFAKEKEEKNFYRNWKPKSMCMTF